MTESNNNSDGMDFIRKSLANEAELKRKMAYEAYVLSGVTWLKVNGEENLQKAIQILQVDIRTWNEVTKSTIPFTLTTVDAMLQSLQIIPPLMGQDEGMKLIQNRAYNERLAMLSAVRNKLLKDRDDKLKSVNPELSTGK